MGATIKNSSAKIKLIFEAAISRIIAFPKKYGGTIEATIKRRCSSNFMLT